MRGSPLPFVAWLPSGLPQPCGAHLGVSDGSNTNEAAAVSANEISHSKHARPTARGPHQPVPLSATDNAATQHKSATKPNANALSANGWDSPCWLFPAGCAPRDFTHILTDITEQQTATALRPVTCHDSPTLRYLMSSTAAAAVPAPHTTLAAWRHFCMSVSVTRPDARRCLNVPYKRADVRAVLFVSAATRSSVFCFFKAPQPGILILYLVLL